MIAKKIFSVRQTAVLGGGRRGYEVNVRTHRLDKEDKNLLE